MQDRTDDETCTDCGGSGFDGMRERRCFCQPPAQQTTDPNGLTRAFLVEIVARAQREAWRDRENMRAETLDWQHLCGAEHLDCIASAEAGIAAIEAAGVVLVPRDAMTHRFVSPYAKEKTANE